MSVGSLGESMLHSLRRQRVRKWLRTNARPGTILFLCHGNRCRSPFAEQVFARERPEFLRRLFDTTSAGFIGVDKPSPPEAIAAAARLGIDLSAHRSRIVTAEMIRAASLVVVMSPEQLHGLHARFGSSAVPVITLGDLDPQRVATRGIRDPWNNPPDVFDETFARIERCIRELVRHVTWAP